MFSRFFKSKCYKKSKSCLNTIKVKVEIIQRKRNAVQKFLKNDIAELLRRGHDYSAYQRAAGLLMEYNKSLCYELIDKYSGCVLNYLDDLNKQRDCPDECKEAVQTLIYAAARFADLPELRELRALLTQKHGNSFQPYLSQEFVSKWRQDLPARETTIQLLHDIAGEFSLQWDSNALIQQIYRSPSSCEEKSKDEEEKSNEGEGSRKDVISIYDSGGDDEDESRSMRSSMWSQDSKKASSSSSSSSSSLPSISEDDDEAQNNKKPFSSGLVPPPYSLVPKPNNDQVDEEKPKPTPKPKGISVRTIRSGPPARHVHPKLPEFDNLTTQLASIRQS
ncbi:vacuolar protein sorting-associated protein IST1-like [Neltuma alba]|uniref:vacuolar protein sorting-associated protein IST1-like n=1 Tax=Neltuma alba TaxID=207710 RepID=UPI0010A4FA93|nr:vacuolar protein sorting-associated protein IST1-like [Prosopis alba]